MKKLLDIYEKCVDWLEIVIILSIVSVIGAQIISRTLLDQPLKFPEEVAVFLMIAFVFVGIGIVEKYDAHLGVEILREMLPPALRKLAILTGKILTLIMVIAILIGEKQLFPRIAVLKTTAVGIPYIWLHTVMVVFSLMWALCIIIGIYNLFKRNEV